LAEAVDALYAPPGMRFERRVGVTLLIVMGMASSGRVIAVLCDEVERTTDSGSSDVVRWSARISMSGGGTSDG
jgi:hypothetical protein